MREGIRNAVAVVTLVAAFGAASRFIEGDPEGCDMYAVNTAAKARQFAIRCMAFTPECGTPPPGCEEEVLREACRLEISRIKNRNMSGEIPIWPYIEPETDNRNCQILGAYVVR